MTDDLVQFLRDRLDEDERIAKEAGKRSREWRLAGGFDDQELGDAHWLSPPELMHAERHDPARVLADVEAKRALLDDLLAEPHAVLTPGGSTQIYCTGDSGQGEPCECGRDNRLNRYLRLLALPYAKHSDYREEWRP